MATRIGWNLHAQIHGDPLRLARERLLYAWRDALDEDAERFLGKVLPQMTCEDLLVWLARRGAEPRELPDDAVPSQEIARTFLARWKPEDGFSTSNFGDGFWFGSASVFGIDSDIWNEIADGMLERLAPLPDTEERVHLRRVLAASMRGCPLYESLREVRDRPWPPSHVVRGRVLSLWSDALFALVKVRRDPNACVRTLVERARRGAEVGDLEPLWVLDQLGLLERVADPREVLPQRTTFPFIYPPAEESHADAEAVASNVSCGEYPVTLALQWPGPGREVAHEWLRGILLDLLARGVSPRALATYLFDGRTYWADSPARAALKAWLQATANFDALMRASIDAGVSMPLAWVTVVRDLVAATKGAWQRALSWFTHTLSVENDEPEEEAEEGTRLLTYNLTCLFNQIPEWVVLPAESNGPCSALYWIALHAPLGANADEGLAALVELAIHKLGEWRAKQERVTHPRFDPWLRLVWLRVASMPVTTARRARLFEMLRKQSHLVEVAEVRAVLDALAPLASDELPPFACSLFSDDDNLRQTLLWYRRHGGAAAVASMRAWFDELNGAPDGVEPKAFVLLDVCVVECDEDWRRRVHATFAARSLSWIVHYRERVEAALGLPLDLLSIARERLHGAESFSGLPDTSEFVPLLVERLAYIASSKSGRCSGWPPCEALALARRLVAAKVDPALFRESLLLRLDTEAIEHAVEFLDMLEGAGEPRSALIALALARIALREGDLMSVATADTTIWLAHRVTTRSVWDQEGAAVITALLDDAPHALARLVHAAVGFARPREEGGEVRGVCDAILLAFARAFAERARVAIDAGDKGRAKALLLALMELDAPSFAMRFIRPLRKVSGTEGEIATILAACDQQLRHDTDRVSSPDNVSRAIGTLLRRPSRSVAATTA